MGTSDLYNNLAQSLTQNRYAATGQAGYNSLGEFWDQNKNGILASTAAVAPFVAAGAAPAIAGALGPAAPAAQTAVELSPMAAFYSDQASKQAQSMPTFSSALEQLRNVAPPNGYPLPPIPQFNPQVSPSYIGMSLQII